MTSVVFLIPAEEEMLEASEYYERQTFGLGSAFLAEVRRTVLRMALLEIGNGVSSVVQRSFPLRLLCIKVGRGQQTGR